MDYTIKLGVEIDTDGLQGKINAAVGDLKPITLGIEFDDVKKEIKSLTHELKTLNNKSNFKLDTSMVEKSLSDVASVIRDIKTSIGTLDAGAGMKSLLTSINQISTALERASGQFEGLNAALETLGSKDFNINLGINMGGSNNPVARNTNFGRKVRNETLPELQKQVKAYEDYFAKYYEGKYRKGSSPLSGLLTGSSVWQKNKTNVYDINQRMADTSSLEEQIKAYRQYISIIKEAASLKGIDVSSVTSQFSVSAEKLVQDTIDIKTGAKETEETLNKLKGIFSGGADLSGLSTQLDSIVADLGEIRTAIQSLSSSTSLDGLTASFNGLSETLEKLNDNIVLVQNSLSTGFSGLANVGSGAIGNVENVSDASTAAVIQNEKKKQEAIQQTSDENERVLANSVSTNLSNGLKNADIEIEATESQLKNLKTALSTIGFEKSSVDSIASDFEKLGITVKKVSSLLRDDGSVTLTVKGIDQFGNAVTAINNISKDGSRSSWATAISKDFDETEKAFKRLKTLGKEISGLDIKIAGLDADKNKAEIEALIAQLNRLEKEYDELFDTTEKNLTAGQIDELAQDIAKGSERVDTVKAKVSDKAAVKKAQEEANETEKAFKRLKILGKEMSGLEVNISGLDANKNKTEIQALIAQINKLAKEYDNLFAITKNKLAPSQIDELNKILASSDFAESRFKANLVDGIKLNLGDSGNFETKVQEIESSVRRLSNVPDELEGNVKRLRDALTDMTTASEEGNIDRLISKYKEFVKVQGEVENQLKQTKISQDEAARAQKKANDEIRLAQKKENFSNEINNWLRENTRAAADFGDRIQELQRRLKSCDDIELGNLREEWKGIKLEAKLAGKTGGTFVDKIKSQFEKYSAYFGVAELFMYAEQGLRDMFEQVKLIDSAMTELKKVTNETDASYNAFLKNAATKSKEIGTTIDGFVSSTADFARLGYDFEESQGLAEVANIYAVVGDEIDGVEGATQSLVSTLAAFKDEMNGMSDSDFAMSIVDKFNEVDVLAS